MGTRGNRTERTEQETCHTVSDEEVVVQQLTSAKRMDLAYLFRKEVASTIHVFLLLKTFSNKI